MSDVTPIQSLRAPRDRAARNAENGVPGQGGSTTPPHRRFQPQSVFFNRRELDAILSVYGRMVAAGEWRDYAIDGLRDVATFSIFRRTSEMPIYRVEKRPKLTRRQGAYAVLSASGQILKRGHDLPQVLKVLERKLLRIVDGA